MPLKGIAGLTDGKIGCRIAKSPAGHGEGLGKTVDYHGPLVHRA